MLGKSSGAVGETPLTSFVRIKHVNTVRRDGRVYHYHRLTKERLPEEPQARALRVLAINAHLAKVEVLDDGSLKALVIHYKSSPEFQKNISEATQEDYSKYLDILQEKFGHLPVRDVTREDVLELRNVYQATPRVADYFVQVISRLLSFALNFPRRYGIEHHPAQRIGKIAKGEGYKAWPDNVVLEARKKADKEIRWAIDLILYTGQRQGDACRMTWASIKDGRIAIEQSKTGTPLQIRIHKELATTLETIPRKQLTILTNSRGLPWKGKALQHRVTDLMKAIKFPGYTLHGLRKLAGKTLAEAGCSAKEIQAILGHLTLEECERYTKEADQPRLADAAILKWEGSLQNAVTKTAKRRKRERK